MVDIGWKIIIVIVEIIIIMQYAFINIEFQTSHIVY